MTALVIAPHADDEVLGMGGTIAKYLAAGNAITVAVVTGPGTTPHPIWPADLWTKLHGECRAAMGALGGPQLLFRNLPAACLDAVPAYEINKVIGDLIADVKPEEIYVPFAHDLHKDHGAIAYAASVAARPYLASAKQVRRILAYETLSETHLAPPYLVPSFQPNVFIDISETLENKIAAMSAYASQIQVDTLPRSAAALRALATIRGTHIGVAAAEAFVLLGEYQR